MHIPDGILPAAVCVAGYATTAGATWYSLRKINEQENPQESVPKAALLTAAFFVASWIHIPVPPTSVHLVLNGLLGVVLGYYAFPAILIGLFFQAVMFQHGGLTTLGVNATIMGLPALLAYFVFRLRSRLGLSDSRIWTGVFGFLSGALGLGIAALLAFTILIITIPGNIDAAAERASITALILAHVPLMLIEGLFTALVVTFLQRVKPELLNENGDAKLSP
ncbi:MAG: cobalt transporter CbiM [Chloroflexi bacterium]|nr:cobalt transporter CbiM [Chloroflexota bacterium]